MLDSPNTSVPEFSLFEEYKLITAHDMLHLLVQEFYKLAVGLERVIHDLSRRPPNEVARPSNELTVMIGKMVQNLEAIQLGVSSMALDETARGFITGRYTNSTIAEAFRSVQETIRRELSGRVFLYIPQHKASYYSQSDLFGLTVSQAFPSARYDISEAGSCYATARGTACVYHLMRALEIPLRLLARDVGVAEDENWNKVLNNFDKMLNAIREKMLANSAAKPPDWKEQEQFYSEASALLRNVKNAWRNDVMHTEKIYTEEQAQRILNTSKDFMQFLATRLSE